MQGCITIVVRKRWSFMCQAETLSRRRTVLRKIESDSENLRRTENPPFIRETYSQQREWLNDNAYYVAVDSGVVRARKNLKKVMES